MVWAAIRRPVVEELGVKVEEVVVTAVATKPAVVVAALVTALLVVVVEYSHETGTP